MRKLFTLLVLLIVTTNVNAGVLDSLTNLYNAEENDSLKARLCLELGDYYEMRKVDEAIKWGKRGLKHAERFGNQEFQVRVLNYLATYYQRKGDYVKQISLCMKAFKIAEGKNYFELQGGLATNIGGAYIRLNDDQQAIYWLDKSVKLNAKYGSLNKQSGALNNFASFYFEKGEFDKAIELQKQALSKARESGASGRIANVLSNLADSYLIKEDFIQAEKLFNEAIQMYKVSKDSYGINKVYLDFSYMYERMKKNSKAIAYADSAFILADSMDFKEMGHDAALQLAQLYEKTGNSSLAYTYQKHAYELWKLLNKEETAKSLNELRTMYEIEKFESENLLLKKDNIIKDLDIEKNASKIAQQNIVIFSAAGGLAILVFLLYFLSKWNKEKRVKNELLSLQKEELEKKNTEILDSIQYAKRIQAAILPPKARIRELFPESFVYYAPKDVVAGDFYWVEEKDGNYLFAAADCTGHGVPGAMVSVVCNNGLNRAVREHGLTEPGRILDKAREIVQEEFEKSEEDVNDGMDIALCSINNNRLNYAGANNPLWLIRDGELIEVKANKQPIGKFATPVDYTTHELALKKGDAIYLFTDGFIDQFGGAGDKKYKSPNFKRFLISISNLPMSDQFIALQNEFNSWMGKNEQIDDVCVFGVRIQ